MTESPGSLSLTAIERALDCAFQFRGGDQVRGNDDDLGCGFVEHVAERVAIVVGNINVLAVLDRLVDAAQGAQPLVARKP